MDVDEALYAVENLGPDHLPDAAHALAAEVRRLRELSDTHATQAYHAELEVRRLRERVNTLEVLLEGERRDRAELQDGDA